MARKEKDFQAEVRQSLRLLPNVKWYFKIPDAGFRNPFDAVLIYQGNAIAMEYKISKSRTSIPLSTLFSGREHELRSLKRFVDAGGKAFVIINVWAPHEWNYCYCIPVYEYVDLMNEVLPKKSIKLDDERLKQYIRMEKIDFDGKVWDLTKLI